MCDRKFGHILGGWWFLHRGHDPVLGRECPKSFPTLRTGGGHWGSTHALLDAIYRAKPKADPKQTRTPRARLDALARMIDSRGSRPSPRRKMASSLASTASRTLFFRCVPNDWKQHNSVQNSGLCPWLFSGGLNSSGDCTDMHSSCVHRSGQVHLFGHIHEQRGHWDRS